MKLKKFSTFPIKVKLLGALSLITLFSGLSMLIAFTFVYGNVSSEVSTLASKTLDVYANQIDITLDDLQQYSYTTMFSNEFQEDLKTFHYSEDNYERLAAGNRIQDLLFLYTTYFNLIHRIDIYSTNAELLNTSSPHTADGGTLDEGAADIVAAGGRTVWGMVHTQTECITLSRLIRTINNNFTYLPLGIITFYIDVEELTNVSSLNQNFYTSCFVIADADGNILYNSSDDFVLTDVSGLKSSSLNRIQGSSYFSIQKSSVVTPWTYYLFFPEQEVMGGIPRIFRNCGILLLLLFGVTSFFCIRMARRITLPLSSLAQQMDRVSDGNFQIDTSSLLRYTDQDEILDICLHFIEMTGQIDRLITENYKVTLLNKEAQIKSLQAQMDPHFLYNALDSINWMAKLGGQPAIATSVQSLSVLLRKTIDRQEKETTLEKELHLLEHYLSIQKLRFQDRLVFEKIVDDTLLGICIPVLVLQPIVENSVKYALELMETPCHIFLRAFRVKDFCKITISDNGPGIPPDTLLRITDALAQTSVDVEVPFSASGNGIGLKNAADRIRLFYHIPKPLVIRNNETCGITVTITLPLPAPVNQEDADS